MDQEAQRSRQRLDELRHTVQRVASEVTTILPIPKMYLVLCHRSLGRSIIADCCSACVQLLLTCHEAGDSKEPVNLGALRSLSK